MMTESGLAKRMAEMFVAVSTPHSFPVMIGAYSAFLGLFVPSAGGKWIIEAPYVLGAANTLKVHLGWVVQTYNATEALANLVHPFWMLPLLGILGLKARDIIGYTVLQFIVHVPLVLFLVWALNYTLQYVAPAIAVGAVVVWLDLFHLHDWDLWRFAGHSHRFGPRFVEEIYPSVMLGFYGGNLLWFFVSFWPAGRHPVRAALLCASIGGTCFLAYAVLISLDRPMNSAFLTEFFLILALVLAGGSIFGFVTSVIVRLIESGFLLFIRRRNDRT